MDKKARKKFKISASILSSDFTKLPQTIEMLQKEVDSLHLDVMDGHFVPNLTFGPKMISDLRKLTNLTFNTHLMISNPDSFIKEYADAGSDIIIFHIEAVQNAMHTIQLISDTGCKVGIALKPNTPVSSVEPFLKHLDIVLIMTVEPGFGGQKFIANTRQKIIDICSLRESLSESTTANYKFKISLDGGINPQALMDIKTLDFDEVIVGSYLFKDDFHDNLVKLKKICY